MYTATLQKTDVRPEGKIDAIVVISDGKNAFTKVFTIGLREKDVDAAIKEQVKHFIDGLENADAKVALVTNGVLDLSSVPSTVATQAELDRNAWIVSYHRLVGAQKMIDLGILSDTQPQYVTLKNKVIADFKPAYVNFV